MSTLSDLLRRLTIKPRLGLLTLLCRVERTAAAAERLGRQALKLRAAVVVLKLGRDMAVRAAGR